MILSHLFTRIEIAGKKEFCATDGSVIRAGKQQGACRMKKKNDHRTGFTLVEMLLTIVIIAILSGLVVGVSGYANRKSAESQAETDLQQLANILEEYRLEVGKYPQRTVSVSEDLFTKDPEGKNLNKALEEKMEKLTKAFFWDTTTKKYDFTDPWGNAYKYKGISRFSYELYSMGPDGKTGTTYDKDNIYSSQKTTGAN